MVRTGTPPKASQFTPPKEPGAGYTVINWLASLAFFYALYYALLHNYTINNVPFPSASWASFLISLVQLGYNFAIVFVGCVLTGIGGWGVALSITHTTNWQGGVKGIVKFLISNLVFACFVFFAIFYSLESLGWFLTILIYAGLKILTMSWIELTSYKSGVVVMKKLNHVTEKVSGV